MQPIYFVSPFNFFYAPHFPVYPPASSSYPSHLQFVQETVAPATQPPVTQVGSSDSPDLMRDSSKRARKRARKNKKDDIPMLTNRNILPNMSNVVLSYLRRVNKSGQEVMKALELSFGHDLEGNQYKMKRFYAYQNYLKTNVNDYIIRDAIKVVMKHSNPICPVFTLEEQSTFNAVFRRVARKYLQEQYLLNILNGSMEPAKMKDHLKVRRFLLNLLKGQV